MNLAKSRSNRYFSFFTFLFIYFFFISFFLFHFQMERLFNTPINIFCFFFFACLSVFRRFIDTTLTKTSWLKCLIRIVHFHLPPHIYWIDTNKKKTKTHKQTTALCNGYSYSFRYNLEITYFDLLKWFVASSMHVSMSVCRWCEETYILCAYN